MQKDQDITKMVEMGFTAEQASHALHKQNGNFDNALSYLLNDDGSNTLNTRHRDQDRSQKFNTNRPEKPAYGMYNYIITVNLF